MSGGFGKLFLCYRVLWWRQREVQSADIAALVTGTHTIGAIDVAPDSDVRASDSDVRRH